MICTLSILPLDGTSGDAVIITFDLEALSLGCDHTNRRYIHIDVTVVSCFEYLACWRCVSIGTRSAQINLPVLAETSRPALVWNR